jgi:hypothetical protein
VGSAGPIRYFFDGAANYGANADNFLDSASDPGGAITPGSGTISIYATYIPGSNLTHVGRRTIGATPSAGLRADFKRGSSITFPQAGKVTALTAYLDGKANPNVNFQLIRFALYKDLNGVPARLVAQSQYGAISGGAPGRWYTLGVPDGIVTAGKYWLVLHTGGSDGLARYMADGTGNWYGNADFFNDESSAPFGIGTPGNGTISAFASYLPGTTLQKTLGNVVAGGFVEVTFADHFNEASRFRLVTPRATLNGLYAYFDGLAGGSGTQQVRMAVYRDNPAIGSASDIVAVSNVLTINSGRQPGWVKFDITPTALPPGFYWISVHTGPNAVIRKYFDGGGSSLVNYHDDFADGPGGFVNNDGELFAGGSNLSVYATYTTN